jgi:adenylate cyclase
MKLIRKYKSEIKTIITFTLLGTLAGVTYPILTILISKFVELHLQTFLQPLRNGAMIGFLIGFISSVCEVTLFEKDLQKLRFLYLLTVRSTFYLIIISFSVMFVAAAEQSRLNGIAITEVIYTDDYKEFIFGRDFFKIVMFAVAVSIIVNFMRQLNRLMGQNVFINYITGKYHHPKEEERIVMFLDLKSSTTIAEKLGLYKYHNFISEVFYDTTLSIVECKGKILHYVGDEIVITWKLNKAYCEKNCIKCFFDISNRLEELKENYIEKYGFYPKFKAAVHGGKIIIGEIGLVKKELAFHGDVMNTTSRILSQCNPLQKELLISEDIVHSVKCADNLKVEAIGKYKLKGKEEEVELYSISEKDK